MRTGEGRTCVKLPGQIVINKSHCRLSIRLHITGSSIVLNCGCGRDLRLHCDYYDCKKLQENATDEATIAVVILLWKALQPQYCGRNCDCQP